MTIQLAGYIPFFSLKTQKLTKEEKIHAEKLVALKKTIEECKAELKSSQENFNNVTEPKMIDFYIYKIQAEQSRFEQLLFEYRQEEQRYIVS